MRLPLSRRTVARLIAPALAAAALMPAAPASAGIGTPGCASGGTNFSDVSSANAWVSAGFSDGTAFSDHDSTGGNGAEAKGGGGTGVSPAETDMIGSGETLTTAAPHADVPTIQYYHAGTAADCYTYFRLRLAAPAQGGGGDFSSYSYKYAIGNATTGTIGWFYIGGAGGTNTRSIQDVDGNNVVTDTGWAGMGGDDQLWWADTSTANADNIGYWVSWKYSSAELAQAALTIPGLSGVFATRYGVLAGTTTSGNGTVWNKDCTDGFPPTDANQPPNSLDSCIPSLALWQWLLREPAPTMTITNGTQTGAVVEETRTVGTAISPVTIHATTGVIDTYTIACDPTLPQFLAETPTATTPLNTVGSSVSDSSTVSIAGTLSPTAAVGRYHCVITGWGPGGSVTTDYFLNVVASPRSVLYDGNGNTGGTVPANESVTAGSTYAVADQLPTRTGYTFGGWDSGTVVYPNTDSFVMPDRDVTLTARWIPNPPVIKSANGTDTATVVEETQTAGSPIKTVIPIVDPTSGPVDTYTIDCSGTGLPATISATPSPAIGTPSVTSPESITISGTLSPTAAVGTYHCVIKAYGPGGVSVTDYYLHVLPLLKSVLYLGTGATSGVPSNDSQTVGGTYTVKSGTPVRTGYTFGGWDSGTATYNNPNTFVMPNRDVTLTAKWTPVAPIINVKTGPADSTTVSAIETRTVGQAIAGITIKPVGDGIIETYTISCSPDLPAYILAVPTPNSGETATAADGVSISGTLALFANIGTYHCVITAHGPGGTSTVDYRLVVQPMYHELTTAVQGLGSVNIGPGVTTHESGTVVSLSATPAHGQHFVKWLGDCAGTANPVNVTMDQARSCTAVFEPNPMYPLTIEVKGQGSVTPGAQYYDPFTRVTLTATPAAGWFFTGWSGACSGTATACEVTMTSAKHVIANFVQGVTITTKTNGSGTVKSSQPTGTPLLPGTRVTLTAEPAPGWKFTGWSGSCSGTDNPLSVTLEVSKDCTANFVEEPKPVALVAKNDTYRTTQNNVLRLPAGASILNNDGSTVTKVQAVSKTKHGTISLGANGKLVYTPKKGFVGIDSFKYKAFDANGNSVIATVRIVVSPPKPTTIKTGR